MILSDTYLATKAKISAHLAQLGWSVEEAGPIGSNYSSINEFCTGRPAGLRWIASDRAKSFYDKFYPEFDRIVSVA